MATVIDLDALKSTELVKLGRRGTVEVQEMTGLDEKALIADLARPARVRPHLFAEELLARTSGLSRADIRSLNAVVRRRLTTAVVRVNEWDSDWRALYGSHLTADERLLAVAVSGQRRSRKRLLEQIRENIKRNDEAASETRAQTSAQVEASIERVAGAGVLDAFKTMNKLHQTFAAMDKVSAVLRGPHMTSPGLAALTGRHPAFVSPVSPSFANALRAKTAPLARPRFLDVIVGLDRTRDSVRSVTRGITTPGLTAAGIFGAQAALKSKIVTSLRLVDAVQGTGAGAFAAAARNSAFLGQVPSLSVLDQVAKITSPFEHLKGLDAWRQQWDWEVVDEFLASWEDHALWFLFSLLGMRSGAKLAKLAHTDVESVVYDALEAVLTDEELSAALATDLSQHPDLQGPYIEQMQLAFEYARVGKYHLAQPFLHAAFESMLYQRALRQGVVKANEGKFAAAEKLLKGLFSAGDLFLNFTVRLVFGGTGNSYRHGRSVEGHREVTLAGIVALAGYMDVTTGTHAVKMITADMAAQLDGVLEARGLVVAELSA